MRGSESYTGGGGSIPFGSVTAMVFHGPLERKKKPGQIPMYVPDKRSVRKRKGD